jgi:4-aminobutyrate aminotransferase
MNAVEFNVPGTATPDADFTNRVRLRALEKGLILLTCGVYGNVIRFLSPITIQDEVFAEALDILENALRDCAKGA